MSKDREMGKQRQMLVDVRYFSMSGEEVELGKSWNQGTEGFVCWIEGIESHCAGSGELWLEFELGSSAIGINLEWWGKAGSGKGMTAGAS